MNVETLEKVSNPFIIPINSTTDTTTEKLTNVDILPVNEEIPFNHLNEEEISASQIVKRPRIPLLQEKV